MKQETLKETKQDEIEHLLSTETNKKRLLEDVKQETLEDDFMVWDELFGILAWKFKPIKSGDMFIDSEKVFDELKSKFKLKKK